MAKTIKVILAAVKEWTDFKLGMWPSKDGEKEAKRFRIRE
jgi:hypothetical protein